MVIIAFEQDAFRHAMAKSIGLSPNQIVIESIETVGLLSGVGINDTWIATPNSILHRFEETKPRRVLNTTHCAQLAELVVALVRREWSEFKCWEVRDTHRERDCGYRAGLWAPIDYAMILGAEEEAGVASSNSSSTSSSTSTSDVGNFSMVEKAIATECALYNESLTNETFRADLHRNNFSSYPESTWMLKATQMNQNLTSNWLDVMVAHYESAVMYGQGELWKIDLALGVFSPHRTRPSPPRPNDTRWGDRDELTPADDFDAVSTPFMPTGDFTIDENPGRSQVGHAWRDTVVLGTDVLLKLRELVSLNAATNAPRESSFEKPYTFDSAGCGDSDGVEGCGGVLVTFRTDLSKENVPLTLESFGDFERITLRKIVADASGIPLNKVMIKDVTADYDLQGVRDEHARVYPGPCRHFPCSVNDTTRAPTKSPTTPPTETPQPTMNPDVTYRPSSAPTAAPVTETAAPTRAPTLPIKTAGVNVTFVTDEQIAPMAFSLSAFGDIERLMLRKGIASILQVKPDQVFVVDVHPSTNSLTGSGVRTKFVVDAGLIFNEGTFREKEQYAVRKSISEASDVHVSQVSLDGITTRTYGSGVNISWTIDTLAIPVPLTPESFGDFEEHRVRQAIADLLSDVAINQVFLENTTRPVVAAEGVAASHEVGGSIAGVYAGDVWVTLRVESNVPRRLLSVDSFGAFEKMELKRELARTLSIDDADVNTHIAIRTIEPGPPDDMCFGKLDKLVAYEIERLSAITFLPTAAPSAAPTTTPSAMPSTAAPTQVPTTSIPSTAPTAAPTNDTVAPTQAPTTSPTTATPTLTTNAPTVAPSTAPSSTPTTNVPTLAPTSAPSTAPSAPSFAPSTMPTVFNTTHAPSIAPSAAPTSAPSKTPTAANYTYAPSIAPTHAPSTLPTSHPSAAPSMMPTSAPSVSPTVAPTATPTSTLFASYGVLPPNCTLLLREFGSLQFDASRINVSAMGGFEHASERHEITKQRCCIELGKNATSGLWHNPRGIDVTVVIDPGEQFKRATFRGKEQTAFAKAIAAVAHVNAENVAIIGIKTTRSFPGVLPTNGLFKSGKYCDTRIDIGAGYEDPTNDGSDAQDITDSGAKYALRPTWPAVDVTFAIKKTPALRYAPGNFGDFEQQIFRQAIAEVTGVLLDDVAIVAETDGLSSGLREYKVEDGLVEPWYHGVNPGGSYIALTPTLRPTREPSTGAPIDVNDPFATPSPTPAPTPPPTKAPTAPPTDAHTGRAAGVDIHFAVHVKADRDARGREKLQSIDVASFGETARAQLAAAIAHVTQVGTDAVTIQSVVAGMMGEAGANFGPHHGEHFTADHDSEAQVGVVHVEPTQCYSKKGRYASHAHAATAAFETYDPNTPSYNAQIGQMSQAWSLVNVAVGDWVEKGTWLSGPKSFPVVNVSIGRMHAGGSYGTKFEQKGLSWTEVRLMSGRLYLFHQRLAQNPHFHRSDIGDYTSPVGFNGVIPDAYDAGWHAYDGSDDGSWRSARIAERDQVHRGPPRDDYINDHTALRFSGCVDEGETSSSVDCGHRQWWHFAAQRCIPCDGRSVAPYDASGSKPLNWAENLFYTKIQTINVLLDADLQNAQGTATREIPNPDYNADRLFQIKDPNAEQKLPRGDLPMQQNAFNQWVTPRQIENGYTLAWVEGQGCVAASSMNAIDELQSVYGIDINAPNSQWSNASNIIAQQGARSAVWYVSPIENHWSHAEESGAFNNTWGEEYATETVTNFSGGTSTTHTYARKVIESGVGGALFGHTGVVDGSTIWMWGGATLHAHDTVLGSDSRNPFSPLRRIGPHGHWDANVMVGYADDHRQNITNTSAEFDASSFASRVFHTATLLPNNFERASEMQALNDSAYMLVFGGLVAALGSHGEWALRWPPHNTHHRSAGGHGAGNTSLASNETLVLRLPRWDQMLYDEIQSPAHTAASRNGLPGSSTKSIWSALPTPQWAVVPTLLTMRPRARASHVAIIEPTLPGGDGALRLWVHGGTGHANVVFGDVWCLTINPITLGQIFRPQTTDAHMLSPIMQWSSATSFDSIARHGHSAIVYKDAAIVFGGTTVPYGANNSVIGLFQEGGGHSGRTSGATRDHPYDSPFVRSLLRAPRRFTFDGVGGGGWSTIEQRNADGILVHDLAIGCEGVTTLELLLHAESEESDLLRSVPSARTLHVAALRESTMVLT